MAKSAIERELPRSLSSGILSQHFRLISEPLYSSRRTTEPFWDFRISELELNPILRVFELLPRHSNSLLR